MTRYKRAILVLLENNKSKNNFKHSGKKKRNKEKKSVKANERLKK
jgi:hypothetical protein